MVALFLLISNAIPFFSIKILNFFIVSKIDYKALKASEKSCRIQNAPGIFSLFPSGFSGGLL